MIHHLKQTLITFVAYCFEAPTMNSNIPGSHLKLYPLHYLLFLHCQLCNKGVKIPSHKLLIICPQSTYHLMTTLMIGKVKRSTDSTHIFYLCV